jgi:CBS domain-containing protein
MKVAEVMTHSVVTTTPETTIEEVARVMIQHRIGGVPVVITGGTIVGIVTEGDLLRRAEFGAGESHKRWFELFITRGRPRQDHERSHAFYVRDVMTGKVVCVSPDTALAEAMALMESRLINRLPVLRDGRLIGIVSRADLLRALTELLPKISTAAVSDSDIRKRLLAEIGKEFCSARTKIDVMVEDGTVVLRGLIFDASEREALRLVAENVPWVKRVRDDLVWI